VLPPAHRLRSSRDFAEVLRRGRRVGRPLLVVSVLTAAAPGPPRAGLVVGKAVGGSVVRSRTSRRLRHLLRDRMDRLPAGSRVVVRALPGAGTAPSSALGADLDRALDRALVP
jgi:ribonuclease P protein component